MFRIETMATPARVPCLTPRRRVPTTATLHEADPSGLDGSEARLASSEAPHALPTTLAHVRGMRYAADHRRPHSQAYNWSPS